MDDAMKNFPINMTRFLKRLNPSGGMKRNQSKAGCQLQIVRDSFLQSIITAVQSWSHQRCAEDTKDWLVQESNLTLQQQRCHLANYSIL